MISGKKYLQTDFEGKKILQGNAWPKKSSTLKKKKSFMASAGKNLTPMYVRKKLSPEVWEKIPPLPLLLKANGQPLSIKLQLGRFIPGNGKWNSYRWTR